MIIIIVIYVVCQKWGCLRIVSLNCEHLTKILAQFLEMAIKMSSAISAGAELLASETTGLKGHAHIAI